MARHLTVTLTLLVCACAGGQTGEITREGTCERVTDRLALGDLTPEESARLESAIAPWAGPFAWDDGAETVVRYGAVPREGVDVEVRGDGACVNLRVPLTLSLSTDDGLLDETLEAHAVLVVGGGPVGLDATRPVAAIEGTLDLAPFAPAPEGALFLSADREAERSSGRLFLRPAEDADEVSLGAF